jgi:OmcA/MtrC family decaheme c-type cytochrome
VNLLLGSTDNTARAPSGFTGSPSFLIAHSGSAANPQDYINWDDAVSASAYATGQPKSVQIVQTVSATGTVTKGLPVTSTDNQVFTTKLTGLNSFPGDAKMRAVGLQAYFTQTNVDISFPPDGVPDNVARHTPAVYFPVDKDAKRRVIVKSGYVDSADKLVDNPAVIANLKPVGCLECHEAFEGHGGNRVNNVQVCVMCHNPQLTTSGRTIVGTAAIPINPTIVSKLGSDPLKYPEVTQSMGSLIHGLHGGLSATGSDPAASTTNAAGLRQNNIRVNNFQIVRNRNETVDGVTRAGVYLDSAEVTYPGDLTHCTKCHYAANPPAQTPVAPTTQSYKADLPTGVLFGTEKVTTGISGETLSQIISARQSFQGHDPSGNPTDLVDSPLVGKCGYCHDTPAAIGHFLSTGGADIKNTRSTAELTPPPLAPVFAAP